MARKCKHHFNESNNIIYCIHCGKQMEHLCLWKIIETKSINTYTRYGNNVTGEIYISQCTTCGDLKEDRLTL
jgi:hypothetical protein